MPGLTDGHDRTRRFPHHALSDRTEQHPGQTASATGAHDHEVEGITRRATQNLTGWVTAVYQFTVPKRAQLLLGFVS
ncbi:hypothetical protein GCM10008955_37720 [Deinococcus malanensis]|uniref:Uncharacterized protein n=1 Tax=Deinococcus malanensis TaxID=1706855 RepID=A0ABQ2F231_9DEIO|nr:hypothetical protein GCM10008955_37720 [Deinococcus malanensis]